MCPLAGGALKEEESEALASLTDREREIHALTGEGLTDRQIGQWRYLAEKTVRNHLSRLPAKLRVKRCIQAIIITDADRCITEAARRHWAGVPQRPASGDGRRALSDSGGGITPRVPW